MMFANVMKLKLVMQAARFRVYAYDSAGNVLGEINKSSGYTLKWTVHVSNKKAAYYLFSGTIHSLPCCSMERCTKLIAQCLKGGYETRRLTSETLTWIRW